MIVPGLASTALEVVDVDVDDDDDVVVYALSFTLHSSHSKYSRWQQ